MQQKSIKIKHSQQTRKLTLGINGTEYTLASSSLSFSSLKSHIAFLFKLTTDFHLTYLDNESDRISIDTDEELFDALSAGIGVFWVEESNSLNDQDEREEGRENLLLDSEYRPIRISSTSLCNERYVAQKELSSPKVSSLPPHSSELPPASSNESRMHKQGDPRTSMEDFKAEMLLNPGKYKGYGDYLKRNCATLPSSSKDEEKVEFECDGKTPDQLASILNEFHYRRLLTQTAISHTLQKIIQSASFAPENVNQWEYIRNELRYAQVIAFTAFQTTLSSISSAFTCESARDEYLKNFEQALDNEEQPEMDEVPNWGDKVEMFFANLGNDMKIGWQNQMNKENLSKKARASFDFAAEVAHGVGDWVQIISEIITKTIVNQERINNRIAARNDSTGIAGIFSSLDKLIGDLGDIICEPFEQQSQSETQNSSPLIGSFPTEKEEELLIGSEFEVHEQDNKLQESTLIGYFPTGNGTPLISPAETEAVEVSLIGSSPTNEKSEQVAKEPVKEDSLIGSFSEVDQPRQQESSRVGPAIHLPMEASPVFSQLFVRSKNSEYVACGPVKEEPPVIGTFPEAKQREREPRDSTYENDLSKYTYDKSEMVSIDELLRGSGPSSHQEAGILERSLYLESDKEEEYSGIALNDVVNEKSDVGSCDGVAGSVEEEGKIGIESEEEDDFVMVD